MFGDKDRLYVCLYARGGEAKMPGKDDTYHWGFIQGPKIETQTSRGMRYHAKNAISSAGGTQWIFEATPCLVRSTTMLLVRVVVGKVEDSERLESVMRSVPVIQGDASWNCVIWVKVALEKLRVDGKALGSSQLDWEVVRNAAMEYIQRKKDQHRYDVENSGIYDMTKPPTLDLLIGKETIP